MIKLPDLPYAYDALEPHISERTLRLHHDKHHNAYVTKTNKLVQDTPFKDEDLETIIRKTQDDSYYATLFNQAAQAWNHDFYWRSLTPNGGGNPHPMFEDLIEVSYGNPERFREALIETAAGQFGSGWAWLTLGTHRLNVTSTSNAVPAFCLDEVPLLTIDVWEHAYYLDYQNDRGAHVKTIVDKLLNWEFAAENLRQALAANDQMEAASERVARSA